MLGSTLTRPRGFRLLGAQVFAASAAALVLAAVPKVTLAATYKVGPGQSFAQITEIETMLAPGDVVEVMGDATYQGNIHIRPESSGTSAQKVTLRGIPVNGKRPVISGGAEYGIVLHASHFVFEGFEVTGGAAYCVVHKGDDVTIRDVVVHDCPMHGILGTDSESGDLTMEYTEVYANGNGDHHHQIYIATDESMYPGSRFRMQHCYVHDGNGGNNVKTRSERNEIYYNWIEGASVGYHLLDMIGPDGQDPTLAREDSDVVGNVLIQHGMWNVARMGGDGTGETQGRYRFAYNTIILDSSAQIFRAQDGIDSLEVDDNVFYLPQGGSPNLLDDSGAAWASGQRVAIGHNNFVDAHMSPDFLTGTIAGADPGFENGAAFQFVPVKSSPLVDQSVGPVGPSGHEIPSPLDAPVFVPPPRGIDNGLAAAARNLVGPLDVGAFEFGSPTNPATSSTGSGATGSTGSGTGAGSGGAGSGGAGGAGGPLEGGCSCRLADGPRSAPSKGALWASGALAFAAMRLRRRRRAS